MTFPSIRIEGAILSGELLAKLDTGECPGQRPADFGFDSAGKLKEEIVRAWTAAQAFYGAFQHKLQGVKEGAPATSETRNQWIIPLLGLLRLENSGLSRRSWMRRSMKRWDRRGSRGAVRQDQAPSQAEGMQRRGGES